MSVTVKDFTVKFDNVDYVRQLLKEAGIDKDLDDILSIEDKNNLLKYLMSDVNGDVAIRRRKTDVKTYSLPTDKDLDVMVAENYKQLIANVIRSESINNVEEVIVDDDIDDKNIENVNAENIVSQQEDFVEEVNEIVADNDIVNDAQDYNKEAKEDLITDNNSNNLAKNVGDSLNSQDEDTVVQEQNVESQNLTKKISLKDNILDSIEDSKNIKKDKLSKSEKKKAKKEEKSAKIESDKLNILKVDNKPAEKNTITANNEKKNKIITVPAQITVAKLAQEMSIKVVDLQKFLMEIDVAATLNQNIDADTALLAIEQFGFIGQLQHVADIKGEVDINKFIKQADGLVKESERYPVVTVMGHVDHGKTSLLDYVRNTRSTSSEAGGITQHIGAYLVKGKKGNITFLDTPGHAAFSAMRARGANCTDIVVLVVAADDGVKPQTVEAIQHAKASKVPIIVAVNKIDKPEANVDKVKNDLTQFEIVPEDWGGDNQFVSISAKTGEGIDDLLDAILLQAEILELKAPKNCPSSGVVIESQLIKGQGVSVSLLIQRGTLKQNDIILAGDNYGKIKAIIDDKGKRLKSSSVSTPVRVLGFDSPPQAGEIFVTMKNEKAARGASTLKQDENRKNKIFRQNEKRAEQFLVHDNEEDLDYINVIVKADVHGSMEAIQSSLENLSTDKVKVKVVGQGVGGINESDITLAMVTQAFVIGFNVRADLGAKKIAEKEKIKYNYYNVIYDLIDDVKNLISGLAAPEIHEKIIGLAEVRDVFKSSKIGAIAGCIVSEGVIKRNSEVRVLRDNVVIYSGNISSLRRFKDDVTEVKNGFECGISIKNYNDVKLKDKIEAFEKVEVFNEK